MKTYSFFALVREGSIYEYPGHELVEEEDLKSAIYKLSVDHNMTIAEIDDEDVWMKLPDGAMVKYDVVEK